MASLGSEVLGFLMQNSLYVIFASLVTVTVILLSTSYLKYKILTSRTSEKEPQKISDKISAVKDKPDVSSASESKTNGEIAGDEVDETDDEPVIDPVTYCEHIQGEIKKVKQKVATRKICEGLTKEQLAEERERQREQLSQIFKLMQEQKERFGINSMEEMQDQMRLYANF